MDAIANDNLKSSDISHHVRNLRCRLGWCQSELAHHLGISRSTVLAWESGEGEPSAEQVQSLESLFRRSEDSMLEILEAPRAEDICQKEELESVILRNRN